MAEIPAIEVPVKVQVELSEDVRLQALEGGRAYLVTVPADTPSDDLSAMRNNLRRWMLNQEFPPQLIIIRDDIPVEPLPESERCPHCGSTVSAPLPPLPEKTS